MCDSNQVGNQRKQNYGATRGPKKPVMLYLPAGDNWLMLLSLLKETIAQIKAENCTVH